MPSEDWRRHFGPRWHDFVRAKSRFDPRGILPMQRRHTTTTRRTTADRNREGKPSGLSSCFRMSATAPAGVPVCRPRSRTAPPTTPHRR
ncbi:hypothetical protein [Streptomyces sp. STR69]|uniref:hypothetical protein n=1 Tax=Streptomyces sp. STR69 TaxID=1796942 RepID=UPI003967514B